MRKIQMTDLPAQYAGIKSEINEAIQQVLDSAAFIKGPQVAEFEKNLAQYTGAQYVISCANGTDALQIALMALELNPGDEVITPAFSYAAMAEAILLMGLKPVFVDVNPETFLIDTALIENAITPKTRVIAPVHLYGQTCDMEVILDIAQKHNLFVLEDNAQAIGSNYTFSDGRVAQSGTIGHIGTTSFFPSKNLGCYGDGGAIFTNDSALAERIKMIANHGQKVKYFHEIIGVNSRLDTLQAAILNVKLKYLHSYEQNRNKVADHYDKALRDINDIVLPARLVNSTHVFHQYTIKLKNAEQRDVLKGYLNDHSIPSMIHYPKPLHQQNAYAQNISFKYSEDLCTRVLSLPICSETDEEQIQYITDKIKDFFNKTT